MKRKMLISLCIGILSFAAIFGVIKLVTNDADNDTSITESNSNTNSHSNFNLSKFEDSHYTYEGIYTSESKIGSGTNYYVSTDGSDSNDGATKDSALNTVSAAMKKVKAGDTIIIRKGVYSEQINFTESGTSSEPITLKAYEGEDVVFDFGKTQITEGLVIDSKSYINIEGIKISNITETSATGIGIYIHGTSSNITIKNCEIFNIKAKNSKGNSHAILVSGNSTTNAISNIRLENNYVHDCETGWSEAISLNGNVEKSDVINNNVANINNIGIDIIGGEGTASNTGLDIAREVYVAGNIVSSCKSTYARSAGIYVDGAKDVWVNGNIIVDSQAGIEVGAECKNGNSENVVVSNNLLCDNNEVSLVVGVYEKNTGKVQNVNILNNTIYHSGTDQVIEINAINNINFKNNIFYSTSNSTIIETGSFGKSDITKLTFDNNLVYGNRDVSYNYSGKEYDFDGFNSLINAKNNINSDPMFNDEESDFSLKNTSPCIDKGIKISNIDIGTIDLNGKNRTNKTIDIGAYEYNKN